MTREFDEFCADFHAHFTRNANDCVALGVEKHLGELPDPSVEEAQACVAEARLLLQRLSLLAARERSFDEALDLDLARLTLEAQIHGETYTWNGRTARQQTPSAGGDVGDGIFLLFANDPRPDAERLADVTARLEAVPDHLATSLARLDTPVERWVAIDLEKVGELPGLFDSLEEWAKEQGWSERGRLARACEDAKASLAEYAAGLSALPTTTRLHLDSDAARRIVELRGIDESLEELHETARSFLATNRREVEELRGRLVKKYGLAPDVGAEELANFLSRRFALKVSSDQLEEVLVRYQDERRRILEFIGERDLFPILPGQDMKILRTPGFMTPSIPAGAMMSPPPFREGVRTSLVYLTLSEELLAEHTQLDIPGMMIHEGIPGHHLHLATASTHPSIIRRHMSAMDQAEGWTTMLEDYMLDVGYAADLADEMRFKAKRDIARIGARVAIDLFFMTGDRGYLEVGVDCDVSSDDPFEAAGSLLGAVTGFTPGRLQAELNWYSQERGYPLCYLTGNRLVWELKRDVAERQNARLSGLALDRRFHEVYLQAGSMPVSFLRRVFEEEGLC